MVYLKHSIEASKSLGLVLNNTPLVSSAGSKSALSSVCFK